MNIEELRIGNLVYFHPVNTHREVCQVDANMIFNFELNKPYYKPIELNPSWLERMGFKFEKGINTYWSIGVNPITHDYLLVIKCNNECFYYRNIHHTLIYVHQLQNLYFALTGKEIKIKQLEKV